MVLVTETFPPEVNGVAMTLGRLVKGIASRGHQLLIVRPRQKMEEGFEEGEGIRERIVPGVPLPRYPDLRLGLPAGKTLRREFQSFRPDLVHIATEGLLGWSALRVACSNQLPVTSSFHTNFHTYGNHYGLGLLGRAGFAYLRAFHNRTLATFAPTREICRELDSRGMKRLRLLSRGVDGKLYSPDRRSEELRGIWGVGDSGPAVLYVGRLAAEKNIPLAVEAFRAFQSERPEARFVLVGDGPLRKSLQKANPDFHFAGMRHGEDLAAHYASGDLFLAPSETETYGNVVPEAMASGLIVVTYDYASGRERITSGEDGFLVPFGDGKAFVEQVRTLAKEPTAWATIREAAAARIKEQTWDVVVDQFIADLMDLRENFSIHGAPLAFENERSG